MSMKTVQIKPKYAFGGPGRSDRVGEFRRKNFIIHQR